MTVNCLYFTTSYIYSTSTRDFGSVSYYTEQNNKRIWEFRKMNECIVNLNKIFSSYLQMGI